MDKNKIYVSYLALVPNHTDMAIFEDGVRMWRGKESMDGGFPDLHFGLPDGSEIVVSEKTFRVDLDHLLNARGNHSAHSLVSPIVEP